MACNNKSDFHDDLVKEIPHLRAFARYLMSNQCLADDLVQATLLRALDRLHLFQEGTRLRAWLFTIERNLYYTELRKYRREVEDIDGRHAGRLTTPARHIDALAFQDLKAALATLPDTQREALVLVGAAGASYEEAAEICGCALGTVKSRVNRGRAQLSAAMDDRETDGRSPRRRTGMPPGDEPAAAAGR